MFEKEKAQAGSVPEEVILHVQPVAPRSPMRVASFAHGREDVTFDRSGENARVGFIQDARTLAPFQPGPGEVRRRARDNWPGIAARPPPRVRTMFFLCGTAE